MNFFPTVLVLDCAPVYLVLLHKQWIRSRSRIRFYLSIAYVDQDLSQAASTQVYEFISGHSCRYGPGVVGICVGRRSAVVVTCWPLRPLPTSASFPATTFAGLATPGTTPTTRCTPSLGSPSPSQACPVFAAAIVRCSARRSRWSMAGNLFLSVAIDRHRYGIITVVRGRRLVYMKRFTAVKIHS